ncbi:hypothetical protein GGS20DRAFT_452232 [Poronia punctata]|nr:hypothetical protein GGS20DRAFT_452232 [Poronia punctata]
MSKLAVVFPLLMVALICIAIYTQVTSSTLSLPISTGTTVLTILLPLFAAANVYFTPVLTRFFHSANYQQFLPYALHILQGGLTLVIATLALQGSLPGRMLDCGLEENWQQLWSNHDGRGIERIQNAFECCGFRSLKDRDWPRGQCRNIYDNRHSSCIEPWRASMQRTSGLEFTVAVVVGLIQLAHLIYLQRQGRSTTGNNADYRRLPHRVEAGENGRLIEEDPEAYHDADDEENGVEPTSSQSQPADFGEEPPHRVMPSGLGGEEANQWRT